MTNFDLDPILAAPWLIILGKKEGTENIPQLLGAHHQPFPPPHCLPGRKSQSGLRTRLAKSLLVISLSRVLVKISPGLEGGKTQGSWLQDPETCPLDTRGSE